MLSIMDCWESASDNIEFAHNLSLELGTNVLFYYDPKRKKVWQEQPDWSATKTKVDYSDPLNERSDAKHDAVYVHSIVSHALVKMINNKDYCGFAVTESMGLLSQRAIEPRPISDIVVQDVRRTNNNYSLALQLEGVIGWIQRWDRGLHMIVGLFNYDNNDDVRGAAIIDKFLSLSKLFSDRGIEVCQLSPASLTDASHATKLEEATAQNDVFRQIHSHLCEAAKLIGATARSATGTKRSLSQREEESESESDADESGTTTGLPPVLRMWMNALNSACDEPSSNAATETKISRSQREEDSDSSDADSDKSKTTAGLQEMQKLTTALNAACDEPSSNTATETKKLRSSSDDHEAKERAMIMAEVQTTINDKRLPEAVRSRLREAFEMSHHIQHWPLGILRCYASSYRNRSGPMTSDQEEEAVAELEKFLAHRKLFTR